MDWLIEQYESNAPCAMICGLQLNGKDNNMRIIQVVKGTADTQVFTDTSKHR